MKQIYLEIVKNAIREVLEKREIINKNELLEQYPELGKKGAVFVTLNERGRLRGCIGSLKAHRPLLEDFIDNARAAAFNDPRFMPLSAEEFGGVDIEVSILIAH